MEAEFDGAIPDDAKARGKVHSNDQFGRWEEMKCIEVRVQPAQAACGEYGREEGRVGWGRTA